MGIKLDAFKKTGATFGKEVGKEVKSDVVKRTIDPLVDNAFKLLTSPSKDPVALGKAEGAVLLEMSKNGMAPPNTQEGKEERKLLAHVIKQMPKNDPRREYLEEFSKNGFSDDPLRAAGQKVALNSVGKDLSEDGKINYTVGGGSTAGAKPVGQ